MVDEYGVSEFPEKFPFQSFRDSWTRFSRLLDLLVSKGMSCDCCGPYPSEVICDGITMAHQKKFVDAFSSAPAVDTMETPRYRYTMNNLLTCIVCQPESTLLGTVLMGGLTPLIPYFYFKNHMF